MEDLVESAQSRLVENGKKFSYLLGIMGVTCCGYTKSIKKRCRENHSSDYIPTYFFIWRHSIYIVNSTTLVPLTTLVPTLNHEVCTIDNPCKFNGIHSKRLSFKLSFAYYREKVSYESFCFSGSIFDWKKNTSNLYHYFHWRSYLETTGSVDPMNFNFR